VLNRATQATLIASLNVGKIQQKANISLLPSAQIRSAPPLSSPIQTGGGPYRFTFERDLPLKEVVWTLQGPGTLLPLENGSAEYRAPDTLEQPSTVTLSARVGTVQKAFHFVVNPKPVFVVNPPSLILDAGSPTQVLSLRLDYSTDSVQLSLEPNLGKLERGQGNQVLYTPPAKVLEDTTVYMVARAGSVEQRFPLTILPPYGARLVLKRNNVFQFDATYTKASMEWFFITTDEKVKGQPGHIGFNFLPKGNDMTPDVMLNFRTVRLGVPLALGDYLQTQRYPFEEDGHPGLDFSYSHTGCNTSTGSFKILELAYDSLNDFRLKRFHATFTHGCYGREGELGEITYGLLTSILP